MAYHIYPLGIGVTNPATARYYVTFNVQIYSVDCDVCASSIVDTDD